MLEAIRRYLLGPETKIYSRVVGKDPCIHEVSIFKEDEYKGKVNLFAMPRELVLDDD